MFVIDLRLDFTVKQDNDIILDLISLIHCIQVYV